MNAAVLGFVVIALLAGGIIGWLVGSGAAAGARQTVDTLRLELDEVVKERDANRSAATELAALKAGQEEREKAFEARMAELREAKDALSAQFAEVGGKLLETAQKQFLDRADDRFRQSAASPDDRLLRVRARHFAHCRPGVRLEVHPQPALG
jgi:DNA recombination protein RmuC